MPDTLTFVLRSAQRDRFLPSNHHSYQEKSSLTLSATIATICISRRLRLPVAEVIMVDERIFQLRLGFISVVAVYVPTDACKTEKWEMFYVKLDSIGSVTLL